MPSSGKPRHQRLPGFTSRVPIVPRTFTFGETQSLLFSSARDFDSIDYIYVADSDGRLTGVLSIKDVYRHAPSEGVGPLSEKSPLATAGTKSHAEEIAYQALKHGIKAVPVVDEQGKLVGVVPHDGIKRILYREMREDILHLTGVSHGHIAFDNIFEISLLQSVRHRLPWLAVGTIGGLAISEIIGRFEETLRDNLVLAAFIPMVVYIADAVGTQMEAFVIRDFALFRKLDFSRYFTRHFLAVLAIAVMLGGMVTLISLALYRQASVAAVLGLAVAGSTISALFSGLIVPLLFRKARVDPANASGPLGTILQDAFSVAIYFSIASLLL